MAEATAVDRLSTAAARGDLKEIETILQSNVNVNERNKYGRTPLQVRLKSFISFYIHRHVDVNVNNNWTVHVCCVQHLM